MYKGLIPVSKLLSRKVKQIDILSHISHGNILNYRDYSSFLCQSHGKEVVSYYFNFRWLIPNEC